MNGVQDRKKWVVLFLVSVVLMLTGVGYGVYGIFAGFGRIVGEMGRSGVSTLGCLQNRECTRWFNERLAREFNYDFVYWLLPLMPLAALARVRMNEKPRKAPGASRYATVRDVRAYLEGERSGWLGIFQGKPLRYPKELRFGHTLVLGQPGAGKTSRFYEPNLLMDALDGNSLVVVDLKWPNLQGFPRFLPLLETTGHRIELFLPYEPGTKKLPLLRDASDPLVAMEIAEGIIPVDQRATAMTYYKDQERAILAALIRLEATIGAGSMGRLVRLLKQGPKAVKEFVDELGDQRAKEEMGFFYELTPNQQTGLVAGLVGKLQPFDDPRLERATSRGLPHEEIDVAEVARTPTFLYIGIPQDQLMEGVGQVFLQMVVRYINRTLLREARHHGGRCPVPVIIYMDEWANLGYLPGMDVMLATVRERRIAYILTLQNLNQGIKDYGEAEFKAIVNNLNHWVLFPQAVSLDDRKYIAEFLGETTAYEKTVAHGWKGVVPIFDPRLQVAEKEVARLLLSPVEMNSFGEGEALVLGPRLYPLRTWLPRLDESTIGGYRNPLYAYGKHLQELRESPDEVIAAVERHLLPQEEGSEEVPHVPEVRFRDWVKAVVDGEYPVRLFRDPKTLALTKVHVDREVLPEPLATPAFLHEWRRNGWARFEKNDKAIAITLKGLEVLPAEEKVRLEKLGLAWRMAEWAKENQRVIAGLGEEVPTPMAYFEKAALVVPEGALKDIFGEELPRVRELLQPQRTRRKGVESVKLPAVVEYLWDSKVPQPEEDKSAGDGKGKGKERSKGSSDGGSPVDWLFE